LKLDSSRGPALADHRPHDAVRIEIVVDDGQLDQPPNRFDVERHLALRLAGHLREQLVTETVDVGPLLRNRVPRVRQAAVGLGFQYDLRRIDDAHPFCSRTIVEPATQFDSIVNPQ
jgi:hypothetical protein